MKTRPFFTTFLITRTACTCKRNTDVFKKLNMRLKSAYKFFCFCVRSICQALIQDSMLTNLQFSATRKKNYKSFKHNSYNNIYCIFLFNSKNNSSSVIRADRSKNHNNTRCGNNINDLNNNNKFIRNPCLWRCQVWFHIKYQL